MLVLHTFLLPLSTGIFMILVLFILAQGRYASLHMEEVILMATFAKIQCSSVFNAESYEAVL